MKNPSESSPEEQLAVLESIYRNAPIGLCMVDKDLRYIRMNKRLATIQGRPIEDHLGKRISEVVPDLAGDMEASCRKVLESGEPILDLVVHGATEVEPQVKKYWLVRYHPAESKEGSVQGVILILQDITDRRKAEERLIHEKRFSESVIETLPGLFFMLDEEGRYVRWNKNRETVLGYSDEELARMSPEDTVSPEDRPRFAKYLEKALAEGSVTLEYECITREGARIPYLVQGIRAELEGKTYIIGTETDISDRKRLEEQLEAENLYLREEIKTVHEHEEIKGNSKAIREVLVQAEQVASTDSTVLILGETGTGKELVAHAIHKLSGRKDKPMVKVNCAAMPSTLVESELFGREKGAYTGALTKQVGRFEIADGSTIFLDEIGELSPETQAKLLRVLQEGEFQRLGSPDTVRIDVRVITATNRDLAASVKEGTFREDLYYRLNVFPIAIPPLRERQEDIPTLVWSFVQEFGEKMGKRIETIPKNDMELLQRSPWPGNVRELRNVIERAMILCNDTTLRIEMLQAQAAQASLATTLEEVERNHILEILERTAWRVRGPGGAAETLGLKPTTLEARMRKLGIKRQK
ncbi:MAG: sigma 54-interacting transcriptional regulator [Planctomycetota bacterium]